MDSSPTLPARGAVAAYLYNAGKNLMAAIEAEIALFSSSGVRGKCIPADRVQLAADYTPDFGQDGVSIFYSGCFCTVLNCALLL